MWSVVTESPTFTSARAPWSGAIGSGDAAMSTKNGGSWTYVDASSHPNSSPPLTGMAFHAAFDCSMPS